METKLTSNDHQDQTRKTQGSSMIECCCEQRAYVNTGPYESIANDFHLHVWQRRPTSQGSLDMIFPRDRLDPATYQSLDHRSVLGNLGEFQTARSRRSSTSAGPTWQNTLVTPAREQTLELKLIILLDSLVTRQFEPPLLQPGQQIHCPYGRGGQVAAVGFNRSSQHFSAHVWS